MAENKFIETNRKIAAGAAVGFKKIEDGVVEGYKKIENGVVEGYKKIEDGFVGKFLAKDGETPEEAKARMTAEQKARDEKSEEEQRKRLETINKR